MVIFDFDGTLADSFPFLLDVVDKLAEAHGFRHIDHGDIDMLRGCDAKQILHYLSLPKWKIPQIGMHFKTLMAENICRISLFPGVNQMLKHLKQQGVTLALVTSNSLENVRTVLGPDISELITFYECGVSLFGKRRKIRRVCSKAGVTRQEVLCVGDEVRDIIAAHAEKIHFGAVTWGYTKPNALAAHSPEFMFSDVDDLVGAIM